MGTPEESKNQFYECGSDVGMLSPDEPPHVIAPPIGSSAGEFLDPSRDAPRVLRGSPHVFHRVTGWVKTQNENDV